MGAYDFQTNGFKVSGFADLYANLDGLTLKQKQQDLGPLLVAALRPMSLVAISLAPDDPLTGPPWDLKSSITVSTKQRSGRGGLRPLGKYGARAYMGPTKFGYPQAIMQEFGTVKMTATPFMRPAWDSGKEVAMKLIGEGFADAVFKSIKKRYFTIRR